MPLAPEWRNRLIVSIALVSAAIGATQIAQGSMFLVFAFTTGALALVLSSIQPIPLAALVTGIVMAGYLVGNRGFAQISLAGNSPLLPAEFALLLGSVTVILRCAFRREVPYRNDPLNFVILIWVMVGTVRVAFNLRTYGFMAIRDYALVYYAGFFFVAQYLAREPISRRFLIGCLYVGAGVLLIVQPFYLLFPEFFLKNLTIRGTPLIFYKGDLLSVFLAVTSLLYFLRFESNKHILNLLLSIAALIPVLSTDNRASMLGLLVATGFLVAGRRWKFASLQIGGGTCLAILILLFAAAQNRSWETTPVFKFYERVISVVDLSGTQSYKGADTANKGDNNAFRSIWWKITINDTIESNPFIGLGFGYDLTEHFIKEYYPVSENDFTVRSPHNFLVTIFARMGFVGLLPLLAIVALMVQETLRAVRRPRDDIVSPSLWCSSWIIFTSACFGVVLEGPMGAMVFWTTLGLAHHALTARQETSEIKQAAPDALLLPKTEKTAS